MGFDILFLGTGTAFSRYEDNYHNNAVIFTKAGPVLIDCGTTASQALHENGIKPWELAGVIITHLHGDHCGGIEQVIWERYYTGPNGPGFLKTPVYVHPDLEIPLMSYLDPVLNPFTTSDGKQSHAWKDNLVEIKSVIDFAIDDITFNLRKTPHVRNLMQCIDKPACSIFISDVSSRAYYSGDTTLLPGYLTPSSTNGFHTVFHECTFSAKYPGTVHTHYEELLSLDPSVRSKIVLMHYGKVPEHVDIISDGFRAAAMRGQRFCVSSVQ